MTSHPSHLAVLHSLSVYIFFLCKIDTTLLAAMHSLCSFLFLYLYFFFFTKSTSHPYHNPPCCTVFRSFYPFSELSSVFLFLICFPNFGGKRTRNWVVFQLGLHQGKNYIFQPPFLSRWSFHFNSNPLKMDLQQILTQQVLQCTFRTPFLLFRNEEFLNFHKISTTRIE